MTSPVFPAVGADGKLQEKHLPDRISPLPMDGRYKNSEKPEDYGASRDGVTDDRVAIEQAMDAAAISGRSVLLSGGTYAVSGRCTVPDGVTVLSHNATIQQLVSVKDFTLAVGSDVAIIGSLTVKTYPGEVTRGVAFEGERCSADSLSVINDAGGAGNGDGWSPGVYIGGAGTTIRDLAVRGHSFAINLDGASEVTIGRVAVENYIRGIWVRDSQNVQISGTIRGVDPATGLFAGHNGVLIESVAGDGATSDLNFTGLHVYDAGEHGFRVGGSYLVNRVKFDHCSAINVGASGFKVLGSSDYLGPARHEDYEFTGCIVEDAGQRTANDAAFTIHQVRNCQITAPIIRKTAKEYSCGAGVEFQGVTRARVTSPIISDPLVAGVLVYDIRGEVRDVRVDGGSITAPWALQIDGSRNTVSLSDIQVTGATVTGDGVNISSPVANVSNIAFSGSVSGTSSSGDVSSVAADIRSASMPSTGFKRGSVWRQQDRISVLSATGWKRVTGLNELTFWGTFTGVERETMPMEGYTEVPGGWVAGTSGFNVPAGRYLITVHMIGDFATDWSIGGTTITTVKKAVTTAIVELATTDGIYFRAKPNTVGAGAIVNVRAI